MPKVARKKVTKEDPPEEDLFFYEYVYKDRLNWTKHLKPILYKDPSTGFYMEGYLTTANKMESPDSLIKVKSALLPIYFEDVKEVPIKDIYPTNRIIYDSITKDKVDPFPYGKYINAPKDVIEVTPFTLKKFFLSYRGISFTIDYLSNAFNNKINIKDLESLEFLEKIEVLSLLTSQKEIGYRYINNMQNTHTITESFEDLIEQYKDCTNCLLGIKRKEDGRPVVFSKGPSPAEIMVIGEAPGLQEEKNKTPFYEGAPAGGALQKVIEASGLDYNSIHFTNSVLCRPLPPDSSRAQNGKPTIPSIQACNSRLKNQIRLVSPKIVVLLGSYAYQAFTGKSISGILSNLGWHEELSPYYKVYVAEHPSYIIRQVSNTFNPEEVKIIKNNYLKHWKKIKEELEKYDIQN